MYNKFTKARQFLPMVITEQDKNPKEPQACAWINTHGKGRIFSTTLGHHNSTMSTMEYLDMLGNAVRWITAKK